MVKKDNDYNPLIINRPEALDPARRNIEWGITTIGWAIWIFLVRPVLLIFLWILGIRIFTHQMIDLQGFMGLLEKWQLYIGIILAIYIIVRGWNVYNFNRFSKMNRRRTVRDVTVNELAEFFEMPVHRTKDLHQWEDISIEFSSGRGLKIYRSNEKNDALLGRFIPS